VNINWTELLWFVLDAAHVTYARIKATQVSALTHVVTFCANVGQGGGRTIDSLMSELTISHEHLKNSISMLLRMKKSIFINSDEWLKEAYIFFVMSSS